MTDVNDYATSEQDFLWYLKNFNIFENFTDEELEDVVEHLKSEEYQKGETVILPEDKVDRLYFLIRGKVRLTKYAKNGKEITLAILHEGELFGLLSQFFRDYTHPAVVALESSFVAYLHKQDFIAILSRKPDLCMQVNKQLGEQLVKLENRLEDLVFFNIPSRLAKILIKLAEQFPEERNCGTRIDLKLTQEELANLIGATRESTSSAINRFKQQGWIDVHDRFICIHDLDALKKLVHSEKTQG